MTNVVCHLVEINKHGGRKAHRKTLGKGSMDKRRGEDQKDLRHMEEPKDLVGRWRMVDEKHKKRLKTGLTVNRREVETRKVS